MTIKTTEEGKYQALLKGESLGTFETEKEARSAYRKKLREKYREKEKQACRAYYQTHKEYFRRKATERVLTPEQRERQRKYSAEYYKTNTKHRTNQMKNAIEITAEMLDFENKEAKQFNILQTAYLKLHAIRNKWRVVDCTNHIYNAFYLNFHASKEAALAEFKEFIITLQH